MIKVGIFIICIIKYDMFLYDMMEFFCLMFDGLVEIGIIKFIIYFY